MNGCSVETWEMTLCVCVLVRFTPSFHCGIAVAKVHLYLMNANQADGYVLWICV